MFPLADFQLKHGVSTLGGGGEARQKAWQPIKFNLGEFNVTQHYLSLQAHY